MSFRTVALDPDFRRDPRTKVFCALCQKDIAGKPKFFAHMIHSCFEAVHPDDREKADASLPTDENLGLLPVGPDCAKRIGREFLYTAERAAAVLAAASGRSQP